MRRREAASKEQRQAATKKPSVPKMGTMVVRAEIHGAPTKQQMAEAPAESVRVVPEVVRPPNEPAIQSEPLPVEQRRPPTYAEVTQTVQPHFDIPLPGAPKGKWGKKPNKSPLPASGQFATYKGYEPGYNERAEMREGIKAFDDLVARLQRYSYAQQRTPALRVTLVQQAYKWLDNTKPYDKWSEVDRFNLVGPAVEAAMVPSYQEEYGRQYLKGAAQHSRISKATKAAKGYLGRRGIARKGIYLEVPKA
jgi:hypothetical protein